MIEMTCPHCQAVLRIPDTKAGKKGKCPSCQNIIQVPQAAEAQGAQPGSSEESGAPHSGGMLGGLEDLAHAESSAPINDPSQVLGAASAPPPFGPGGGPVPAQQAGPSTGAAAGPVQSAWSQPAAGAANGYGAPAAPQQQAAPAMPSQYAPQQQAGGPTKTSGAGVAALVLGLLGLLSGWVPFICFISVLLSIIGLILGLVGKRSADANPAVGRGLPIAGLILSFLGLALSAFRTYQTIQAIGQAGDAIRQEMQRQENLRNRRRSSLDGEFDGSLVFPTARQITQDVSGAPVACEDVQIVAYRQGRQLDPASASWTR